jgi:hypothetical protein
MTSNDKESENTHSEFCPREFTGLFEFGFEGRVRHHGRLDPHVPQLGRGSE